jgi:hypothetical protein
MSEREQDRGSTLARPRRAGGREVPEPTPGMTGFWPLLVLVLAGTLALAAWALWPSASSDLDSAGSGYSGDWKDTVATERAEGAGEREGAGSGDSGDWKDTVASERAGAGDLDGAGPDHTGDWKDTIATERAGSVAQ